MEFKANDIIKIISACRKFEVSELELEGLKLKFGESKPRITIKDLPSLPELSPEVAKRERKKELEQMEDDAQVEALEQLKLEDPLAYEQKMVEGLNHYGNKEHSVL